MRALCKSPDERYASASAMADDLTRWLSGRRVIASLPRRRIAAWKIWAAISVVAVAALIGVLAGNSSEDPTVAAVRAEQLVLLGRRHLVQNRPTDALIAFGRALEEDPKNKAAAAGKKEAQDRLIATGKPEPKTSAPPAVDAKTAPAPAKQETKAPPAIPPAPMPAPPASPGELAPMKLHENGVHLVAFSPDGRSLVTGSFDNTVRLWDLPGRTERKLLSEKDMPASLAFSRDGRWIAAGYMGGTLRVCAAQAPKELRQQ